MRYKISNRKVVITRLKIRHICLVCKQKHSRRKGSFRYGLSKLVSDPITQVSYRKTPLKQLAIREHSMSLSAILKRMKTSTGSEVGVLTPPRMYWRHTENSHAVVVNLSTQQKIPWLCKYHNEQSEDRTMAGKNSTLHRTGKESLRFLETQRADSL